MRSRLVANGEGDVTAVSEAKINSKRDFAWVQRGRVLVQTTHWQIRKAQKPNRFFGGRVCYGFFGGTVQGFRKQRQRGTSILHGYPDRSRGTGERERESSKLKRERERETERERAKPFVLSFGHPV